VTRRSVRRQSARRRADRSGPRGSEREVVIEALGARGDGIARLDDARAFVPLTLPGDRLTVRLGARREGGFAAEPLAWHEQAPRAAPRCPHFGACGGCQLQHLHPAADAAWRRVQVATALARRGLEALVIEPAPMPPATRRRARLAFERRGGRVVLGFRARAGHAAVDVAACALVLPEIEGLLPPLRAALADLPLAARAGEVLVTATDGGLDLVLLSAASPGLADREGIAALAGAQDLARVSWQRAAAHKPEVVEPEVIVARRPVRVTFGGVPVALPPGAFLQASAQAEAQIRAAVCEAIGNATSLADLFAGCGTFGLPLAAAGRRVHAVDAQAEMLAALTAAARTAGLADRVTTETRDLERAPLAGPELDRFSAVILDPPRSGARAQAQALAASKVARVAMVSCNPASFSRDARMLTDGGFALTAVRLVDAFLWSAQIELVGSFSRP
jgi:23S rRNA (uracil1939-C5)-methyltransferase